VTARLASLPKAAQFAIVAGVLVLVLGIGYFALIAPKRSTAASLKKQTAAVQAEIAANKSSGFTQAAPAVRSASVFALTQAMPTSLDTPDVVLTLNQLAHESGLSFDEIAPQPPSATPTASTDPFAVQPITVRFSGSYYSLLTFLQRMRNLVRVQNGRLFTAGRLFDVTDVAFSQGQQGWPQIGATLTIDEFVPQASSTTTPVTSDTTSTDTTSTTTTPATTTSSDSTSAAPSTSGGAS
jgi:Tfp pilus assembly protein PilO